MPDPHDFPRWLLPYQPQLPLPELIVRANEIFHDCEASHYDRRHPEATGEWANRWRDMIAEALRQNPGRQWRILDFGCGTGFASSQLLKYLPAASVMSLTCYDLSPRMLECCRAKIANLFPDALFCNRLEGLAEGGPFNLLATNALLHHLPSPARTMSELLPSLARDAVWLAGVEPSVRFYKNDECARHHEQYRRLQRRSALRSSIRFLKPSYWSKKIPKLLHLVPCPRKATARLAVKQGLFKRQPPAELIDRLVDYHVAHSTKEAEAGRGFDIQDLQAMLADYWAPAWFKSFAFMGKLPENELPRRWRSSCAELAARFPLDGAFFTAIWRRADHRR
jgi:SAM-dependent methyltransferase